jgi:Rha family phage regulatory protein
LYIAKPWGNRTPKGDIDMSNELTVTTPTVTIKNNAVVANSRDVAEFFGKQHKNVLRDIDAILDEIQGSDLSRGWFIPVSTPHPKVHGINIRSFDMTRDGFTLLVMGYTGSDAMRFKVAYIQEFNRMEEALKAPAGPALPDFSNPAIAARAWAEQYEQRQIAEEEKERLALENQTMAPKANAWDELCNAEGTISSRDLAAILGLRSPQALHKTLREQGFIKPKLGKDQKSIQGWLVCAKYAERGYHRTTMEAHNRVTKAHTRWTPAGAAHIAERLARTQGY